MMGFASLREPATTAALAAQRDCVAFLASGAAFPDAGGRVEVVETHFAWVFLAGARAYKLKKATHLRGADWRTIAARERACRDELNLNHAFSPATYLGVEPLTRTGDALRIGGHGAAVDWLLVMRRLDAARMLDAVLRAGALTPSDLDRVLEFLVALYRARTPLPFTPDRYLRRLDARLEEALGALADPAAQLPAAEVARAGARLRATFAALRAPLAARAVGGHIVEGHGDLRAEHVCLGPPVQVIDALEVYADLRMLDTAEEIAVLAVDCAGTAAPWAPPYLRDRYRALTGDDAGDELFAAYAALRAATQAKLAIWHLDDPQQFPDPQPWRARALAALAVAVSHCPRDPGP